MIRIAASFAIVGTAAALILGGCWMYVDHNKIPRTAGVERLEAVTTWLWPTSLMMTTVDNHSWVFAIVVLLVSSLVNGFLYFSGALVLIAIGRKLVVLGGPR